MNHGRIDQADRSIEDALVALASTAWALLTRRLHVPELRLIGLFHPLPAALWRQ
jgi:hypothetical protein